MAFTPTHKKPFLFVYCCDDEEAIPTKVFVSSPRQDESPFISALRTDSTNSVNSNRSCSPSDRGVIHNAAQYMWERRRRSSQDSIESDSSPRFDGDQRPMFKFSKK